MPGSAHQHATKQSRSRATVDRIVAAARELSAAEPLGFERLSVADIAARAGISIGGFYGRFPSKDALAAHLAVEGLAETLLARARERLTPERYAGAGAYAIISDYLALGAGAFRAHRPELRAVSLAGRAGADAPLRATIRRFNKEVHDRFRALLLTRRAEMSHPTPDVAVDTALLWTSAALREVILFDQPVSDLRRLSDVELVEELSRGFAAYLGVAIPSGQSGRRAAGARDSRNRRARGRRAR